MGFSVVVLYVGVSPAKSLTEQYTSMTMLLMKIRRNKDLNYIYRSLRNSEIYMHDISRFSIQYVFFVYCPKGSLRLVEKIFP